MDGAQGKKQVKGLPDGIVGLERTSSPRELAEIYTATDVFFNPTCEDNYPTVNLEAEACGTPIVTYSIGGCRETIRNQGSVAVNSIEEAKKAIESLLDYEKEALRV